MKEIENGKQKVHPFINKNGDAEQGLTKREYFAGLAMQGIMASLNMRVDYAELSEVIATESVLISDALLKELDKPKTEQDETKI